MPLCKEKLMKKFIILTAIVLTTLNCCIAAENYNYSNTLINRTVTVPAGQTFKGVFLAPISSQSATVGQEVSLALSTDYYFKDVLVAPAGSTISGAVIDSARAKHGSIGGKLTLRFTSIITPSGQKIPISAIVKTDDNSGTVIGGENLYKTDNDSIFAPESASQVYDYHISKFKYGKGAMMMNEVGSSGGGLIKSIWDKGKEVDIPINASIELILTQPITVKLINSEN